MGSSHSLARVVILAILAAMFTILLIPGSMGAQFLQEDRRLYGNQAMRSSNAKPVISTSKPLISTPLKTYQVQPGDSLWKIARRHNLDVNSIAQLNDLSMTSVLQIGQKLNLPSQPRRVHRVQSGQTLWQIARIYGVTVEEMIMLNNVENVNRIHIGQLLILPTSTSRVAVSAESDPHYTANPRLLWPLVGVITSPYGWRKGGTHHGIDIAAPTGSPIKAARAGTVTYTGWRHVYGRTVIINHGDGSRTLYGHASKILVKSGQRVKVSQVIAKVGQSGRATGPHLHFELYLGNRTVNPISHLSKS